MAGILCASGLTQSGLPTTRKGCFLESQKKRSCSTEENYRDLRSRQAQTLERGASRSSTDVRHNDQFKNGDIGEFNPIFFDLAYCVRATEIPLLAHDFSKRAPAIWRPSQHELLGTLFSAFVEDDRDACDSLRLIED